MHASVAEVFVAFSKPLEGCVPSLYADIKGLLTVGIGCLADPVSLAMPLPWVMPDGSPAPEDEIAKQWHVVKTQANPRLHWRFAAGLSTMRLTDEGVLEVAKHRLEQNVVVLRKYFHNWDEMPADAQLCCLSMAWAVGAGFPAIFTNFTKLMNAGNYSGAIQACGIKADNNPGVIPRNAANRLCLSNAAKAVALGLPAGELFWPGVPPTSDDKEWKLKAEAEAALALHPPHFGWDTAGQSVSSWAKDDDEEGESKA
jgi:GH24 family phage-related lysozyme (muramidase)